MNSLKQTTPKLPQVDGGDNPFTDAPTAPILASLASLRPHPRNYNAHDATQIDRIAQSLKTFGQRKPITTWHGYILTGHGVYAAAQQLGWTELEIKPCPDEWDEAQALRWLVADNEHAKRADPDQAALATLLQELGQGEDALLAAMGYDAGELAALLAGLAVPEFPEYDESAADDVEMITCPHCGKSFPK